MAKPRCPLPITSPLRPKWGTARSASIFHTRKRWSGGRGGGGGAPRPLKSCWPTERPWIRSACAENRTAWAPSCAEAPLWGGGHSAAPQRCQRWTLSRRSQTGNHDLTPRSNPRGPRLVSGGLDSSQPERRGVGGQWVCAGPPRPGAHPVPEPAARASAERLDRASVQHRGGRGAGGQLPAGAGDRAGAPLAQRDQLPHRQPGPVRRAHVRGLRAPHAGLRLRTSRLGVRRRPVPSGLLPAAGHGVRVGVHAHHDRRGPLRRAGASAAPAHLSAPQRLRRAGHLGAVRGAGAAGRRAHVPRRAQAPRRASLRGVLGLPGASAPALRLGTVAGHLPAPSAGHPPVLRPRVGEAPQPRGARQRDPEPGRLGPRAPPPHFLLARGGRGGVRRLLAAAARLQPAAGSRPPGHRPLRLRAGAAALPLAGHELRLLQPFHLRLAPRQLPRGAAQDPALLAAQDRAPRPEHDRQRDHLMPPRRALRAGELRLPRPQGPPQRSDRRNYFQQQT